MLAKGNLLLAVLRREGDVSREDLSGAAAERFLDCRQAVDEIGADYVAAIEKWREKIERRLVSCRIRAPHEPDAPGRLPCPDPARRDSLQAMKNRETFYSLPAWAAALI